MEEDKIMHEEPEEDEPYIATYEQYNKANIFARFRYKWGIFVMIGCWVSLLILIGFVWYYSEELSEHPAQYMLKQLDVDYCTCYAGPIIWNINSSEMSWEDSTKPKQKVNYDMPNISDIIVP